MTYYNRIDVSEDIDVKKTIVSKKCIICHYWYFLDKRLRFQPTIYNGCHDVLMKSVDINNITILNINVVDYYCIISCIIIGISKSEDINLYKKR